MACLRGQSVLSVHVASSTALAACGRNIQFAKMKTHVSLAALFSTTHHSIIPADYFSCSIYSIVQHPTPLHPSKTNPLLLNFLNKNCGTGTKSPPWLHKHEAIFPFLCH